MLNRVTVNDQSINEDKIDVFTDDSAKQRDVTVVGWGGDKKIGWVYLLRTILPLE